MFTAELGRQMIKWGSSTVFEAGRASDAVTLVDPRIRPAWPGAAACGPAFPVTCAPGDNLAVHQAVECCAPRSVLVVDGAGELVGYWGEILTAAAQAREIAGLVVDGGVRDIDALARRGFPAFARGAGLPGAAKREPGTVGGLVELAGSRIAEGDIVLADTDGVVVVAADRLSEVLVGARERADHETAMFRELAAGRSTMDLFKLRPKN